MRSIALLRGGRPCLLFPRGYYANAATADKKEEGSEVFQSQLKRIQCLSSLRISKTCAVLATWFESISKQAPLPPLAHHSPFVPAVSFEVLESENLFSI